jgi:hypothetical protein
MSETATITPSRPSPPVVPTGMPRQQSLLFPSLFKKMKRDRRLSIFEVGPALPETLEFFTPLKSRLFFADLYSDPLVREPPGDMSEAELRDGFTASMRIPENSRFDLCLLWDFPNYLDDRALRAFSQALEPYLHPGCKAHAFAVRTPETRMGNQWYGIDQPHLFTIRQPWVRQPGIQPHSQAILINLLTCFDIDRGMLLPDGRLEVVMSRSRNSR